jgi:hypothetical protein
MGITEVELKALPRQVGRMKDELQLYRLLADCRLQIMEHDSQVSRGQPCPECHWSVAREHAPCTELEALERTARDAVRASQGGVSLSALAAGWRVEDHRRACVTCQSVRLRLVIEDGAHGTRLCPALKRVFAAKRICMRRIWRLIEQEESGKDLRGVGVEQAGG